MIAKRKPAEPGYGSISRKKDTVKVLTGRDKGKQGRVLFGGPGDGPKSWWST